MAKKKDKKAPEYDPIHDRVLVIPKPDEDVTETGIIIPDTAKEAPQCGHVLKIGPSVDQVEVGDKVWFSRYVGVELKLEGEAHRVIKEKDLLLIER